MRLGRYHVTRKLATGGMGEVLLAIRRAPGGIEKQVVIKRIRQDLSGNPRFVEMFLREARLSLSLSHKNIVPVFDFGKVGQALFIAMEYVRGRDLGRALRAGNKAESRLSPPVVAHIGIEVCRALDHAHSRDDPVIHRDLSPKNLLISFSGEVLVADFGLAGNAAELNQKIRGTPHYMSPEQARGEPLDPRSDLFSLGLVLREALEGRKAYSGVEPAAIIEQARSGELPPIDCEAPKQLARIIEVATRADPDRRPESARDLQEALDHFLVSARAGGAKPPSHELAAWLRKLFPSREPKGVPIDDNSGDGELAAITFLDAGYEALAESALDRTLLSEAATVGDSDDGASEVIEPPATPVSSDGVHPGWLALPIAVVAALAVWMLVGRDGETASQTTAVPAIDAAPAVAGDAAPPDGPIDIDAAAEPEVADAAPTPIPIVRAPGTVVIQTSTWAKVRLGSRILCAETPCSRELSPGRHLLVFINPTTGSTVRRRVTVRSGQVSQVIVTMPLE